ncbi:MAG TPA: efflux RND transporter periplasmic adaptor subunit [Terracidiphilus sp.]|nr:efflux RND transporter periplasmic adaptor subunit [Terracidiphilus sp.]
MSDEHNPHAPAGSHDQAAEQRPVSPRAMLFGLALVLLVACVLAAIGIITRMHSDTVLAQQTRALAAPTVGVAPPSPGAPVDNFVLPGNVTAFTDAPIYSRVDGYLTRWYYDIGAHVEKGALLAVISAPEVDQQLAQAQADLATAQTNAKNAKVQADRYSNLVKSNAVSRLDTDTFVTQAAAAASAVRSAQANVDRLTAMQSFEKIYAPFSGVITARNVDTGQLINAGAGAAAGTELFHMQAIQTLRVYTNVPQLYSGNIKRGEKIPLTFPQFPSQNFEGTLVRTADAIDPVSRTLLVEIDVNNRDGKLMPGALAQVHFRTPPSAPTFIIPVGALIFRREGLQVGTVVNSSRGTVAHLASVVIGQDNGATVQIVSGLNANDRVIQDPPDSLVEGERVTVVTPGSSADQGGF